MFKPCEAGTCGGKPKDCKKCRSSSSSSSSSEEEFRCGESQLILQEKCGDKYAFRLVTEPDKCLLENTLNSIINRLMGIFNGSRVFTEADILGLSIFCDSSALTSLDTPTGIYIGQAGISKLANAFTTLGALMTTYPFVHVSTSHRLVTSDELLFNMQWDLTSASGPISPTNPSRANLVISGLYHIIKCGCNVCIDVVSYKLTTPIA